MLRTKARLDRLLTQRGLVENPEKAVAVIMAGKVLVQGNVIDKPGTEVQHDAEITLLKDSPYVGRGGLKLEGVLNYFSIDVKSATVVDVGASTGGFTDCLLKKGAGKVFAIDIQKEPLSVLEGRMKSEKVLNIQVICHNIESKERLKLSDNSLDLVLMTNILNLLVLQKNIQQYFAVLPSIRSVGVQGDARTYGHAIIIRAIETRDFMTADWAKIPFSVLTAISTRITNEVRGINRVAYDITSKPPATVEWE